MIFSTRTTYGLRAMINLARRQNSGSVSLSQIASEEGISLKYLERLFSHLKKANLVKASKGAAGGYALASRPEKIEVYEIIRALEGKLKAFHCTGEKEQKIYCNNQCNCQVVKVLFRVEAAVNLTLKKIKLNQLL